MAGGGKAERQILEGFRIKGGNRFNVGYENNWLAPGVMVSRNETVIAHCNITGGFLLDYGMWNYAESVGIYLDPSVVSAKIADCTIAGGLVHGLLATVASTGVNVNCPTGQVRMLRNHISTAFVNSELDETGVNGVRIQAGEATLSQNHIVAGPLPTDNLAYGLLHPAAVYVDSAASLTAINNLFVTHPLEIATGVWARGPVVLVGNTFVTDGTWTSRGVYLGGDYGLLVNNIFHIGNADDSIGISVSGGTSVTLIANDFYIKNLIKKFVEVDPIPVLNLNMLNQCNWPGCQQAQGNIGEDPGFVGLSDYHLAPGSPCIDRGADASVWFDEPEIYIDFDGDARPQGEGWDIGFDEVLAR